MTIFWWFMVSILIFEPVVSFDLIPILDNWIFGSSTRREILLDIDAQKKFILEQDFIKRSVQKLQQDIDQINWDIEKWKHYRENCNTVMHFVTNWILDILDKRRAEKHEYLEELLWYQNSEPFCDQYHYSGAYHEHWNSICVKAFQDEFFKTKKWALSTRDNTLCQRIDVYNINKTPQTNDYHKLIHNRWVRRCVAQHEETHLQFDVYLISSIKYKPDNNVFSFFVVVENILKAESSNDRGIFYSLLSNNNRKELIAYIEK